jgi:AcrR family transcriptional regulator
VEIPPHRTRNPWGQGERLRVEILQSAARLLSELGGEQGLSIRGVARAVGIAPASIYQHFADKAALVHALIDYDYEQLAAAMRAADDACPPDDPLARVRAQMHAYSQFAIDSPGHYRLLINNPLRRSPEVPPAGVVGQVVAAFERCEQAGITLRIPARRAAIVVFVGTHGRVALWHASGDPDLAKDVPAFVDELIELVID